MKRHAEAVKQPPYPVAYRSALEIPVTKLR
jgi:hypothetical protein